MLRLVEIDIHNLDQIVDLSVADDQKSFVATNVYSIAQARVQPACVPLGVYDGNTPVGFVMYALDPDEHEYCIYRLMIDKRYQGRGFGREALWLVIKRLQADRERHVIYLSFEPENRWAKHLYESMGFVPDGRMDYGEIVYKLTY